MNAKKLSLSLLMGATLMLAGCSINIPGFSNNSSNNSATSSSAKATSSSVSTKSSSQNTNSQAASSDDEDENATDSNYGKYGNAGLAIIPKEMRGTWYSASENSSSTSQTTFGAHSMSQVESNGDQYNYTTYKQDQGSVNMNNYDDDDMSSTTKNWLSVTFPVINGTKWVRTQGWNQIAGYGSSYAVHYETINGKKVQVLLVSGGAESQIMGVYYRSASLAMQQKGVKYSDLHYITDAN
ncbi:MAG: hypothetical protein Q3959_00510 [Limosilactobacillus sp.]|uniref:hypothetical protein n=1 Tax=Limosilactobacillus sp. TaxID=2773925 RepID=UPI00270A60CD|nr:hypothetical protein [Limosilactobacillus sp.]